MIKRSLIEVRARCMTILKDKEVISLVKETSTPTATHEVVLAITHDQNKARAARWLAIMRRDYPDDFYQLIL